jgi:hypothetical protein
VERPSPRLQHPSPARAGEGKGERVVSPTQGFRPGLRYLAPSELKFLNELLTQDDHAHQEIERRRIPLALLEAFLVRPDQVVRERGALKAYRSKCEIGGKMFLLRVIVDDSVDPAVVVTAYQTTKIAKY